jgi:hypothetical protein
MNASEQILAEVSRIRKETEKTQGTLRSSVMGYSTHMFGDQDDFSYYVNSTHEEALATFEMLLLELDRECRPFLSQKPSAHAVRAVRDLLRVLKDELYVDDKYSGGVWGDTAKVTARVSHRPSKECNMAVRYWERCYENHPGAAAEELARKQKYAQEQQTKKKREEQYRLERQREVEEAQQRSSDMMQEALKRRDYLRQARNAFSVRVNDCFAWLKQDGTAGAEHHYPTYDGATPGDLSKFTALKAIQAGPGGIIGLKHDGTCVVTFPGKDRNSPLHAVARWTDIEELAAGQIHVVGLKKDGTCVAAISGVSGRRNEGQADLSCWRDIQQICCGDYFTVGLKKDGTCVYAGDEICAECKSWKNIVLLGTGDSSIVGISSSGKVFTAGRVNARALETASGIVQVEVMMGYAFALLSDGTVKGYYPGTSVRETNVVALGVSDRLWMLKADGTIVRSRDHFGIPQPPKDLKLFSSYEAYRRKQAAVEEARKLEYERMQRQVCRHCGGGFRRKLFSQVCTACGKKKDY